MSSDIFRRDSRIPPAAQRQLVQWDALRAFVPEPPVPVPLAGACHRPVASDAEQASGGIPCLTPVTFAQRQVRELGVRRALLSARAMRDNAVAAPVRAYHAEVADLIYRGFVQGFCLEEAVAQARAQGWL